MKFFIVVLALFVSSLAVADVQKLTYECKGNARTFVGPSEVPPQSVARGFKFEIGGGTPGFNLKIGSVAASPEFELSSLNKDTTAIQLSAATPLAIDIEKFVTLKLGDLQVSAENVNVSVDASGLVVRGDHVYLHLKNAQGPLAVSGQNGKYNFKTSDGKELKCKVKAN